MTKYSTRVHMVKDAQAYITLLQRFYKLIFRLKHTHVLDLRFKQFVFFCYCPATMYDSNYEIDINYAVALSVV